MENKTKNKLILFASSRNDSSDFGFCSGDGVFIVMICSEELKIKRYEQL